MRAWFAFTEVAVATADKLIELFNEAKARSTGVERERFLAEACGDDWHLKEQVLSLLRAEAEEGDSDFLKHTPHIRQAALVTEKVGDRIGRYKLLQQLGEGGCGVVYMAEQEEPVRRRVALKVIKLGMDTKSVIARFEAERQALALMDHPNIAKVLDAGSTERPVAAGVPPAVEPGVPPGGTGVADSVTRKNSLPSPGGKMPPSTTGERLAATLSAGRPFFVMELVRGIKITDYCDQNNLTTEQRLELFTQVCHAVQHAHQKGIIHRDLKPSNILVTLHDGVPVTKVIDFGVAKATSDQRLTDKTIFTAFEQFIGTPAYMSPEQAEMSGLDIDTRSDIYSLGVLLYELLTSRTPLDPEELLRSGMNEMRRKIREEEPPRPSTRLSTMQVGDLTAIAKHRQADAPKLIHLVHGDLDWIVMKCLEKDRTRRYETANGLAMDLKRHLSNEPVMARPPSRAYQFQKLVRRNKLVFAAASAVAAALVLGLSASTWMFFKAQGEKKKAQTEAAKATAVSDFLQQMLRSANPDALKGSDYSVRQLLDDFSAGLANQLANQPEVEAAVRATIGRAYYRLGVADKAFLHHERALALRRRLFGEQSELVAESLVDCAWACFEQQQVARGETFAREALSIYRKREVLGPPYISGLWALQKQLGAQERYAEVEAVTEEALAIAAKSPRIEFPDVANMIHGLAEAKVKQSEFARAETLALEAVEMHRRLHGPEHLETAWALLSVGNARKGQQKLADAEAAFREALRIFRKYYSAGHKSVDLTMASLKSVLEARGDSAGLEALERQRFANANQRIERNDADAEAWMERALGHADLKLWKAATADSAEAIARFDNVTPAKKMAVGLGCLQLAQRAFAAAQNETAASVSQQAIAVFKQLVQEDPRAGEHLGRSQWQLSQALRNTGRSVQSEAVVREALQVFEKAARDFPTEPLFRQEQAFSHRLIADVMIDLGRLDEAVLHYRAAIDLYGSLSTDVPNNSSYRSEQAYTTWYLGLLLNRAGQTNDAVREFDQALAIYAQANAKFPTDALLRWRRIDLLRERGKFTEAERVIRESFALTNKPPGIPKAELATAMHKLGDVLRDSGKLKEAEETFREAVAMHREVNGNEDLGLGHSLHGLAWVLNQNGKRAEAEAVSREELAMRRKLLGDEHPDVASTLADLTVYLTDQGKLDEVEGMCREALARAKKQFGDAHREVDGALASLARVLQKEGKLAEAEAVSREELAVEKKLSGDEHPLVANSLHQLATVLRDSGKSSEAEALFRESLGMRRKLLGNENLAVAGSLMWLGATLSDQGKRPEAEAAFREALAMRRKLGDEPATIARSLVALAGVLEDQSKLPEAEAMYREHLAIKRKLSGDEHPDVATALAQLTATLLTEKKFIEAEPVARECLAIRETKLPDYWLTFSARSMLGDSLLGQKKFTEAEPLLLSGYEGMKQRAEKIPAGSKRLQESLQHLVRLYEATGQAEKAAEWKRKLAEFDKAAAEKKTAAPKP